MMQKVFLSLSCMLIITACSDPKKDPVQERIVDKSDKGVSPVEKDSIGVYKWETDLCENESTFNARLYTEEELRGTQELWWMVGSMHLSEIDGTASEPNQIEKLSTLKELDLLYKTKKKALQNLKIVNDPFWKGVKKSIQEELKDEYDLTRIGIQAYTNPNALKGNRFSSVCPDLIEALTDEDTTRMMAEWKALVAEQSKNNGSPENVMRRYQNAYNGPDRIMHARTQLITYGWHNRVNHTLPGIPHDEKMHRRFYQLFLETKSECDEP